MPIAIHEITLRHWLLLSAVVHVVLLGIRLSERRMMQAVIPVEFFQTVPAPPAERPVDKPVPPKPKAAPPKKVQEKPVPEKKDVLPKPVPKVQPKVEKPVKKAEEAAEPVKKAVSPQPTSRILMTRQAFPFSYYAKIVQQKVWREWDWSAATGRRKAVVSFAIRRDGTIASARVHDPSGEGLFDQAAVRAVQLAAPFPPLPEAYGEDALDIFFEFNFQE